MKTKERETHNQVFKILDQAMADISALKLDDQSATAGIEVYFHKYLDSKTSSTAICRKAVSDKNTDKESYYKIADVYLKAAKKSVKGTTKERQYNFMISAFKSLEKWLKKGKKAKDRLKKFEIEKQNPGLDLNEK